MIGCLRTLARKQPIIALYFESETVLKIYNLKASLSHQQTDFGLHLVRGVSLKMTLQIRSKSQKSFYIIKRPLSYNSRNIFMISSKSALKVSYQLRIAFMFDIY